MLEFLFKALIDSIVKYSSNDKKVHYQNMISKKILITNFREK